MGYNDSIEEPVWVKGYPFFLHYSLLSFDTKGTQYVYNNKGEFSIPLVPNSNTLLDGL